MTLDSFSYTHRGGRPRNEDAVGIHQVGSHSIFVLADGLGGHQSGEAASACVVQTLTQAPAPGEFCLSQWLEQQIAQANSNVLQMQEQTRKDMRSTVAALVIRQDRAAWAHVGDSRLYYLHDGAIQAYSEDHSMAYKKYLWGQITREQIPTDPDQCCLLQAVGNPTRCRPDRCDFPRLSPGDGFVLCSDGFWELVTEPQICADLAGAGSAREWAERMLDQAARLIQPGCDNLSVITVLVLP